MPEWTLTPLAAASRRLGQVLAPLGPTGGLALFRWLAHAETPRLLAGFAAAGILVRAFAPPGGLRFGLPGAEGEWQRLAQAVEKLK